MKRRWQIFVAPGPDTDPLPIEPSPWHDGRWVRLPYEHWEIILDFGNHHDPRLARELRSLGWAPDRDADDRVIVSDDVLRTLAEWLASLGEAVQRAGPLVPEPTAEVPDAYGNDEHARMLRAVQAVLAEAVRAQQPPRAWIE